MSEHQASRTLVKSPPELWAECSDAQSLARHLGDAVGEIRIKRLEPETAVAWEGEHVSGTVRIEPSGWGTKVTLTAAPEPPVVAEVPEPVAEDPEPVPVAGPESRGPEPLVPDPPARNGFVARFRRWLTSTSVEPAPVQPAPAERTAVVPAPAPVAPPPPEPTPEPEPATNQVDLTAALDSLGKAHHRPFSRA
jgi:hypothetical protein